MRFALTEEQKLLGESVRKFLDDSSGIAEARRFADGNPKYQADLWRSLAALELPGLAVAEEHGGSGASLVELGVVLEALGGVVLPSPFFATVALGITALQESGDEAAQAEHLPALASGQRTATLAYVESAHGAGTEESVETSAVRDGEEWRIVGTKTYVIDGTTADVVVVSAHDGESLALFLVDPSHPTVRRVPIRTLDGTRPLGVLSFDRSPARRLEGNGTAALNRTLTIAAILLSAESLGVAQASLDLSVAYARARVQFDRPIGSFQAIKHKAADMYVAVQTSRAAVMYATWLASTGAEDVGEVASLTHAHVSEAAFRVSAQSLQVLGGIAYAWEHDAHLYFKRAKTSTLILGSPEQHRETSLSVIGL